MLVAKFVTPDLKSPDVFGQLDYSNFGSPVMLTSMLKMLINNLEKILVTLV
jgi:hypothetical protein